jgi:hypothetical protein
MKKIALMIVLGFACSSWAEVASAAINSQSQTFSFSFKLKSRNYKTETRAKSFEEAFEQAAKDCYTHYKNGLPVTEESGLDIIDACANPVSSI